MSIIIIFCSGPKADREEFLEESSQSRHTDAEDANKDLKNWPVWYRDVVVGRVFGIGKFYKGLEAENWDDSRTTEPIRY